MTVNSPDSTYDETVYEIVGWDEAGPENVKGISKIVGWDKTGPENVKGISKIVGWDE